MEITPACSNDMAIEDCATQLKLAQQELKSLHYAISHDLRAPVRAVAGFSQALKEHSDAALDATGKRFLARIEEATQRLNAMIDGILVLSRLSQVELQATLVNLGDMCTAINQELRTQFPHHHPQVTIDASVEAVCDPHLMRTALHALLHNAWKFTQGCANAQINIDASVEQNILTLCVRDNGIGFDTQYSDRLFTPFQHLQARTEYHGLGIGLASVQRIVSRHGGTLSGKSLAPGAELSLTLRYAGN
jgi:light-regulated signal transduction histidine kinase (bacteriophytochrome)